MKYSCTFLLLIIPCIVPAQQKMCLDTLQAIAAKTAIIDSSFDLFSPIDFSKNKLNYLKCVLTSLKNKDALIKKFSAAAFYDNLSQSISFTGDYKTTLEAAQKNYEVLTKEEIEQIKKKVNVLNGYTIVNAQQYILAKAPNYQVVMINEAHDKPLGRVFTYSLLKAMYSKGFKYLAMETFNNRFKNDYTVITKDIGYYTNEPVAAELVREAKRIGFKFITYEDTIYPHTTFQRDSSQAANLYSFVKNNPNTKILVHAGYGHVMKINWDDGAIPLALAFKNISGITPLSIDQTEMVDDGNWQHGRLYYDLTVKNFSIKEPSVFIKNNISSSFAKDSSMYDIMIVHPPTQYKYQRATWYALNGERQANLIEQPNPNVFFTQAYYKDECLKSAIDILIPADQTYLITKDKKCCLYLRKSKYRLVFRDVNYKILMEKDYSAN